ncbi:MAG TPA: CHAT domain-containing protein [Myxococcota bacterium]|nr:CHAT domain-containing protein [Myxococcota bacterium]
MEHEAAQLVRLYAGERASVHPARDAKPGDGEASGTAPSLGVAPGSDAASSSGAAPRPIDPALARALRALRACTPAAAPTSDRLPEIRYEQHLGVARQLYERALYRQALEAALLARDHAAAPGDAAARLELHDLLAKIELQLGRREHAIREAELADQLAAELGATSNRIDYARLYADAGDLERAGVQLERLEPAVASAADRAEYAEVAGYTGLLLGSPREALEQLALALEGHRASYGAGHPSTAAVLQLEGDAHRAAGDFPAAIAAYRETLQLRSAALGPRHAETARTHNAIGVLQADIGDWEGADRSFASAIEILRDTPGGEERVDTITVETNRALARWGSAKDRAAADQYAGALAKLRAALGEDHPGVASAARNLARMELELGDAARAQQLLESALATQQRALGASHPDLAPTRLAIARLLAQRGDFAAAAAESDRAIEALSAALGAEHPLVARARTTRARIALAQGDDAAAREQSTQASRSLLVFSQRTFGAISDRQRALLSQDSREVIGALLSARDSEAKTLFLDLLPHRDSVLRSIAARRAGARGDAQFSAELDELRRRYVAAVLGRGPDTAKRVEALAASIENLEVVQGTRGVLRSADDPARVLRSACENLPRDAALIQLIAFDRTARGRAFETAPAYAALIVRSDGCRVSRVDLGDGVALEQFAEQFATAMRDQRMDEPVARAELARLVVEPLRAELAGVTRWLVVPDGALWGIPIDVLPDPESPDHYLMERVTVGYLTSAYELAEASVATALERALESALLVGAPDFGGGAGGGPIVLTDTGPCQLPAFEELPATRRELDEIASLLVEPRRMLGAEATKSKLEAELASAPRLLHFATHAYFAGSAGCAQAERSDDLRERPIAPNPLLLSGIVLAGANRPARVESERESGILTAYEVAGLDLSGASLVVLSACDTGTGLALRGQEVLGLRWGFRAAGARALVTSLWRSNDAATSRMMRSFYASLASAESKPDALRGAEALRRAKLAQLESETRLGIRRPLIWANFVFSGIL